MKKYYFHSLLTCTSFFIITSLFAQNTVTFTSGSGTWYPPAGCKSFYVQLWGGGSGGNNNYGGGGGSFSQSVVYTVTAARARSGYSYTVGTGGAADGDGTDSKFEACWAYPGLANHAQKYKYNAVGEIAVSYFGGYGGSSYADVFDRYGGGGAGSGFTYGDGNNGSNGAPFTYGGGGSGSGYGGGANGHDGEAPGGGGGGNNGSGARGEIIIFWTCENYSPGEIGNAHTVPYPQELPGADLITNLASPNPGFGYTYSWQDSIANGNWKLIPGAIQSTYELLAIQENTWYRRIINGCNTNTNVSNIIPIKVFSQGNSKKNGVISGKVTSKNGMTGVQGITITAQKTVGLKGSPQTFQYTDTTNTNGDYRISPIYYGDNSIEGGDPDVVNFTIIASKPGHKLSTIINPINLSNISPTSTGNNFTDSTVYSITGRITQSCLSCLPGFMGPFGIGNVKISANDLSVVPVYSDSLKVGSIGSFGVTVADPKNYRFTPAFLNHQFSPPFQNFTVTTDVVNKDFADTTTRVISGKLTDAAGKRIGYGNLIFEGIYQRKDSAAITTFKKRATIASNDSTYSVRLPAGSYYKVTVETFTSAYALKDDRYILEDSLKNFFNKWAMEAPVDISLKDSVRNLVYHRPPVIVLTGLKDTACNTNPNKNPGIVFRTNVPRHFQVNVFEGPPNLNYRVQTTAVNQSADTLADYVRFYTNVTSRSKDNADTLFFRLKNSASGAMLDSFFLPGAPNDIAPNTKPFEVHYIDRYGRMATPLKPRTTVVGTFNPPSTFTTAFPEKPYLILHTPPGDHSYSYWSKDTSIETSIGYSVAANNGTDGFVNVSVGPAVSAEFPLLGISFETEVIATAGYTHKYETNYAVGNEMTETTTSNINFQSNKSGVVNGTSGDVYIGTGLNYLLGISTSVDFIEARPFGACEIEVNEKLFLAPKEIRTEFAYAEDHIVNVIIPQQQRLADEETDPVKKGEHLTQVSVWQQVIDNNKENKKNAAFVRNRSFSNGVIIDESQTSTKSANKAITYDVYAGHEIAAELGLRIANIGASGGANITIMETTGNDTTTSNSAATTIGYHLEDENPGDYYSVDIKKDPVYGTPVFDLLAGTSSCPPEEGAQNRDIPQILSGDMRLDNLAAGRDTIFTITLANKSESGEDRFYNLSVDGTTSEGLVISNSGSSNLVTNQVAYYIPYGESKDVQIGVKKFNKNDQIFSYPNVEFYLTDNCGTLFVPNTFNTARISFNYTSPCGSIALAAPSDGWLVNGGNSNMLPITMNGYTLSTIDSITLQYEKKGTNIWENGFTVKKAGISDPNNFTYSWNIASLKDSIYSLRLKLVCQNGSIIYSADAIGVIDRKGPSLVGKPQPATQQYNPDGGEISFTYNENLDKTNLNQGVVELVRRSNSTIVPVSVNELDGKLIITPLNGLGNIPDSFRVIVNNLVDLYGNLNTKPDTAFFQLDLTPLVSYTGSNVAVVQVTPASIAENGSGKIELHFKLKEKVNKITRVYFNLSGTALFNTDYTISYDTIKQKRCADGTCSSFDFSPVYNQFSGSPAYINIDSNKTEAIIYIDPTEDFEYETDETIRVSLVTGAGYKLQDAVLATATILNSVLPCPQGNILYVDQNATGNNTGASWQHAITSLQTALTRACPGITQVWVAKGTYKPTINTSRDSAFTQKNNLAIYGGFAGTETLLSQRNWRKNPTILSGDIGIVNNNSDNSYNVIRNKDNGLNSSAVLDGFIITGGNANSGQYTGNRGGGVHNHNSAPTYYNCVFTGNNAIEGGGAMFNEGAAPLVVNCVFTGNTAYYGAGLYNESASTQIINSSFSGNQGISPGGAMYTYGAVTPQISNSILWGNSSGIQNAGGAAPVVNYSIVQNGYTGTGNLNIDPLFIVQASAALGSSGDLRLQGCSPAVNAGINAALPTGITTDMTGAPRVVNTTIDMGAFERQSLPLSIIIYVDAAATGNNSGESWANAYTNFNSALSELNFCAPGTTIRVAAGNYNAAVNSSYVFDKLNALISGGYPNGGGTRNPLTYITILKGNVQVFKSITMDGILVQKP